MIAETKTRLRQEFLEKRRSMSVADISKASSEIAERFFDSIDLSKVKTLSTFIRIAKFGEIDTSTIYYRIWKQRPWIRTFAPKTDLETGELTNIALFPDTPLVENRWGVREPADGERIEPQELDLVIVPLLAIDASGHRVGYGKGFYDRFLSACRTDCVKVGVNYFSPVDAISGLGEHDVRLDICITPDATIRF